MESIRKIVVAGLCLTVCLMVLPAWAAEEEEPWALGKVSGQLRYYYYTQRDDVDGQADDDVIESLALGGYLKYETPWIEDMFNGGVAMYTSQPFPETFNQTDRGGTRLLTSQNTGITVLGEAYAKANIQGVVASFYRQKINTPMINPNDSRMIPQTYEAYLLEYDEDDLRLIGGWIDKIKQRDSKHFKYLSEVSGDLDSSRRGMWMAGAEWAPESFESKAYYHAIPDYLQTSFFHLGATHPLGDDLSWRWLLLGLDQRSLGSQDAGGFNVAEGGALAGVTVNGFSLDVGGTIVDDTTDVVAWGSYPFFTDMMGFSNNRAGEKTLYLGTSYDFDRIGWTGFSSSLKASFATTPNEGRTASPDRNEIDLNMNYDFGGEFEGLSILNRWAYLETEDEREGVMVRLRLQYDFQLL